MNKNDFRYMQRGKQVRDLKKNDFSFIQSIKKYNEKTDSALLLIHGFSSSPAAYRYLIPQLKNYDALICPNLPGHGESIKAFAESTSAQWLAGITEVCEDLFKKYKKVDVLGLSLGGLLACKLMEHFAFNHIYLLAPALKLKINEQHYLKLATVLHKLGFKEVRGAAGNLITSKHAEIAYKKLPITTVIEILNLILNHQWVTPNTPVDLFLGRYDQVVSSSEVEKLFQEQPNVSIHWLENSAHVLPLDNNLAQIVECINKNTTLKITDKA